MPHKKCYNVRKYVECTRAERISLASIILEITILAVNTRDKGVQWLEGEIPRLNEVYPLLASGIGLIVDGTDPELVE